MDKVAYEFEKGETELVRARVSEFKGQTRADLRIFFKGEKGDWLPTKRGISFPLDQVAEMKTAINEIEKIAQK